MFVLASMTAETVSGPVKIRNMSPDGALIEGAALPRLGEHLSLRRGKLVAAGRAIWCDGGRAGLRFDHLVDVAAWLPAGGPQQQVSQAFHAIKTGLANVVPLPVAPVGKSPIGKSDLLDAAMALEALADALAEDAGVIANHSTRLQVLDIAAQMLRRCAISVPVDPADSQSRPRVCASRA
jgi:hypothetical protein